MKMKTIAFAAAILTGLAASAVDLSEWRLNSWAGYQPKAKLEKSEDGSLHLFQAAAKHGAGVDSKGRIRVKAGDTVKLTAQVKGKGRMSVNLRCYDERGNWFGISKNTARTELTEEWKEVTMKTKAEDLRGRKTAEVAFLASIEKDGELYMRNARAEVESSEFSGVYTFPRQWTVFAPADPAAEPPLDKIPEEIGGVKGKVVPLDNNMIVMAPFFPEQKIRNTAWLYAELNAAVEGEYTIGAGADYFMAIYVNGKCVLDTLVGGDDSQGPHFSNHQVKVQIRKGENIIAVKFQSGSGKKPAISLGGADDLRNLSSILTVTETFQRDDYEQPGARSGDPKLIQDMLTDGIEIKTTQAVYGKGAVIKFDRTYEMPSKLSEKLFAMGVRVYKIQDAGELIYRIGSVMTMKVTRVEGNPELTLTAYQNGEKLKSVSLPVEALPSDIIFAVDGSEFYINAMSLQDSKLRAVSGKAAFTENGPIRAEIEVNAPSVTVDEFFTGLAKREVKSSNIPFKVALDETFDPVKAGWKLVWSDEFDGKEVDWEKTWMNSPWDPKPKNRDLAYLKDGQLHIKVEFKPDPNNPEQLKGRTIGLYSQKRFSYGYYEAKVRFTKKPGWWAAFWMLDEGRNAAVAGGYEIDIFEDYSTRGGKNVVADNLHVSFGSGVRNYGYHFPVPGPLDDFYIIGCKWTPFEISIYLNGKQIRASSRHSPYQTATYDAINHGFGTSTLYICLSGQCNKSPRFKLEPGEEEYLVDWVRAYEYPRQDDPEVSFKSKPEKSLVKVGEPIAFEVESAPNAGTHSPVKNVYLFDNGNLIDFKEGASGRFDLAIDQKHYGETIWARAGRAKAKAVFDTYPHLFMAVVQDEKGQVAYTQPFPVITDMLPSKPYKGKAAQIPGRISATHFDEGGNGVAYYKQKRGGGTYPAGEEGLIKRVKRLGLREGGEWANYTFETAKPGKYTLELSRSDYRREWPMRAMLLLDGVYIGDLNAKEQEPKAVLKGIEISAGTHRLTVISACAYGVWAADLDFKLD